MAEEPADWDADDFEPSANGIVTKTTGSTRVPIVTDKWEGEDEEETIRENWDDDEDTEKAGDTGATAAAPTAVQVKKKKPLKEKLAEIEERKKKEQEEKRKREEEMKKEMAPLTPKQRMEEKMRQQRLQEEADLALAIEAFGLGKNTEKSTFGVIDAFEPSSKEDFEKFSQLLTDKITKYEKSLHFASFLEILFRNLALSLEAEDIKKLASTLTALYNEKLKLKVKTTGKKTKKKASLVVGKDTDGINDIDGAAGYDEFDDYL